MSAAQQQEPYLKTGPLSKLICPHAKQAMVFLLHDYMNIVAHDADILVARSHPLPGPCIGFPSQLHKAAYMMRQINNPTISVSNTKPCMSRQHMYTTWPHIAPNPEHMCDAAGAGRYGSWVTRTRMICSMRWRASLCSCTTTITARSSHTRERPRPLHIWNSMWSTTSRQSACLCWRAPCSAK